jgi:hypothetical protein
VLDQRRGEGDVDLVGGVRMELVADHQRRLQPVQPRRVGGEHAQVAREHSRHAPIRAEAELQVAVDDVRVLEDAREGARGLEQDPGLLAARGGAVDGRVLDADQVVERDRREKGGFPLAPREQGDELTLGAGRRFGDPLLERLEAEPDLLAEQAELHRRL